MAEIYQTLKSVRKDPVSDTLEISQILPEKAPDPSLNGGVFIMGKEMITKGLLAETVVGNSSAFPLSGATIDFSTHVAGSTIKDNVTVAVASAMVAGQGEDGFKLEVLGAFENKDFSAFFWG